MEKPTGDVALLISKYLLGELTEAERAELQEWTARSPENERYFLTMIRDRGNLKDLLQSYEQDHQRVWQLVSQSIAGAGQPSRIRKMWTIPVAAAIIVAAGITLWLLFADNPHPDSKQHNMPSSELIKSGDNKAVLTLACGEQINLDDAKNGLLANEGSTAISLQDSIVTYKVKTGTSTTAVLYNRINTPRGGQFSLILPDGSRAWLNAASSIRFPTAFDNKQRKVSITGEVYFDVAQVPLPKSRRGEKMPFIVDIYDGKGSLKGAVEVLGTEFNVNAYDNEDAIKTTLVKGTVKVSAAHEAQASQGLVLAPGQQATIRDTTSHQGYTTAQLTLISESDLEAVTGWKDGYIQFADDIPSIMRKLSRWYDIEVEYRGPQPSDKYFGRVSRNEDIHFVLELLQITGGVRFIIEGRKVIVTK